MDNHTEDIPSKVTACMGSSQCMAGLKEDQAEAWVLAEVQHSALVLAC
jgi:hypothetical protein